MFGLVLLISLLVWFPICIHENNADDHVCCNKVIKIRPHLTIIDFLFWLKSWCAMTSDRKRSLSGPITRPRYQGTYQRIWENDFPWVAECGRGISQGFYVLCNAHLYIVSWAKNNLTKHANTHTHTQSYKTKNSFLTLSADLKSKCNVVETVFPLIFLQNTTNLCHIACYRYSPFLTVFKTIKICQCNLQCVFAIQTLLLFLWNINSYYMYSIIVNILKMS